MRLNKAGNHDHAAHVHDFRLPVRPEQLSVVARQHGSYAVIFHQHIAGQHAPLPVHGDENPAGQKRLHAFPSPRYARKSSHRPAASSGRQSICPMVTQPANR